MVNETKSSWKKNDLLASKTFSPSLNTFRTPYVLYTLPRREIETAAALSNHGDRSNCISMYLSLYPHIYVFMLLCFYLFVLPGARLRRRASGQNHVSFLYPSMYISIYVYIYSGERLRRRWATGTGRWRRATSWGRRSETGRSQPARPRWTSTPGTNSMYLSTYLYIFIFIYLSNEK